MILGSRPIRCQTLQHPAPAKASNLGTCPIIIVLCAPLSLSSSSFKILVCFERLVHMTYSPLLINRVCNCSQSCLQCRAASSNRSVTFTDSLSLTSNEMGKACPSHPLAFLVTPPVCLPLSLSLHDEFERRLCQIGGQQDGLDDDPSGCHMQPHQASSSQRAAEDTMLAAGVLSTLPFSSMVGQMDTTHPLLSASSIHCSIPEGRQQLMPRALW